MKSFEFSEQISKRITCVAFSLLPAALFGLTLAGSTAAVTVVDTHRSGTSSLAGLPTPDGSTHARVSQTFGKLPLYFIENRGQTDARVGYYVQGSDKTIYFTDQGLTFVLHGSKGSSNAAGGLRHDPTAQPASSQPEPDIPQTFEHWALKLDFVGARAGARPEGEAQAEAVVSYFKGQRSQWQPGLKNYSRIIYRDLWPGIDLVYAGTVNRMKYTFLVRPGADPAQIKLAYRGATNVRLKATGELEVSTPAGGFSDERPLSWQQRDERQVQVPTSYRIKDRGSNVENRIDPSAIVYGFQVGEYDRSRELVIDPAVLVYAGYIGGGGIDEGNGIAVDSAGNVYITGTTFSPQATFPDGDGFGALSGPDTTHNGALDAFVAKVNAAGTSLVYVGYIGGSGIDEGLGVAVDSGGSAYITGYTQTSDGTFPEGHVFGLDNTFNGGPRDAFVAKINAAGTALVYAGYIGGLEADQGLGIAVDSAGNAYVTGNTHSTEAFGFPDGNGFVTLPGPDKTFNGGVLDAFVAKVNAAGTALVYAGYIGGDSDDTGFGIAVDSGGNAYVTGQTSSSEHTFPDGDGFGTLTGPDTTFNDGFDDAFVAKVNAAGTALIYAGYIGGSGNGDVGHAIAVDAVGNAYVTGKTGSDEMSFPDGNGMGTLVGPDTTFNEGSRDAFVAKINKAGTAFLYAGYIGGSMFDEGRGIAVDNAGNAYICGTTSSTQTSFPDSNGFGTLSGPDTTHNGDRDAFVAKVNTAGTALLYAGYVGGTNEDQGNGIAIDNSGNAYVTGFTFSTATTFPDGDGFGALPGPDNSFNSITTSDAFVVKISPEDPPTEDDFGDAPDTYHTTLTNNGARHKITGPLLGLVRDFEADGLPSANVLGDDTAQTPDDEDGLVQIIPLRRGTTEELSVRVTGFGRLHAWVDFNHDGDFFERDEKVIDDRQVSDGVNNLLVTIPPTGPVNTFTAARFRLVSASGNLGPDGPAPDGEVEDYSLALAVPSLDFGDAPDSYGTLLASDGARHRAATPVLGGSLPDVGSDAVPPLDGTGDDNNAPLDDEEGVTIPTLQVNVGASVTYQVAGIITNAFQAAVQGWFDWNRNGLFDHPAEMAINEIRIRNGTFTNTVTPPTGSGGNTFVRFRISREGGLGPKGFAATGEVEDYSIFIIGEDFGDAPDSYLTKLTNNGARHIATGPFLGANRDSDADGLPSTNARGDDLDQTPDDEDGVIIGRLTIGTTNTVRVNASGEGLLTAFVDLNRGGNFGTGEKVLDRVALNAGVNTLVINIPASASAGSTFARFRLTSSHDPLSAAGAVLDGEVEDYAISLLGDFGDAPDSYHTTQTNRGPWHAPIGPQLGANRDAEAAALSPLDGTGDDADELPDDEDGLVSLTGLARNAIGRLVVNTPTGGKLDAWIDFDVNGQFDDPAERITAAGGTTLGTGDTTLTFTCPSSTASGQGPIQTFARLRISSTGGLPPTALAPEGEVEDHVATILPGLPWLTVAQTAMSGEFRLLILGEAQRSYRIQFTPSLPGGWETLADIISTNSSHIYTDTQAVSATQRFYRLEVRP